MKKVLLTLLVLGVSIAMADGKALYGKCAGCHGVKGEKAPMGKSQKIQGWDAAKVEAALKGYKDGTYGKSMKGLMKGQVASYSDADIKAVAKHIASF